MGYDGSKRFQAVRVSAIADTAMAAVRAAAAPLTPPIAMRGRPRVIEKIAEAA